MPQLHPSRWHELEADFEIAACFRRALEVIERADPKTEGSARAHHYAHHGLMCLHPAVRNPEAAKEFEQRKAGTYKGPTEAKPISQGEELAAMRKQIAELEARLAAQPSAQPSEPNE